MGDCGEGGNDVVSIGGDFALVWSTIADTTRAVLPSGIMQLVTEVITVYRLLVLLSLFLYRLHSYRVYIMALAQATPKYAYKVQYKTIF